MKVVTLDQFLTRDEAEACYEMWKLLRGTGKFSEMAVREILEPVMPRINEALGQQNDAHFLAYAIEYVFTMNSKEN